MILSAIAFATVQTILTDAPASSAIAASAAWVSDLIVGPLATFIAAIGIAWMGFAMLSGRLAVRRGLAAVLGCFLLFGAKGIADGLREATAVDVSSRTAIVPPPPHFAKTPKRSIDTNNYDPYAGAAVMRPDGG
ncbi:MAG: TrbC/VirB2 family protein [Sphingobium sp.]|jgi:type IV secretory pathway VirB2 component (pilin)|nr:MAG: TrbC/VirB2 family protein [Sphingobium sp.]